MEIRPLASIPRITLHRAFSEAFSDYSVPLRLSPEALSELHRRRGVRYDLSVGAFDQERLVGFTFNGLGTFDGRLAGYDAGTGVIPAARGRGLARRMMERSLRLLATQGAERSILEVLQTNHRAIALYRDIGFRIRRELLCWRLCDVPPRREVPGLVIQSAGPTQTVGQTVGQAVNQAVNQAGFDVHRDAPPLWAWAPSWQNSSESIARATAARTVLVARVGDTLAGYGIVFSNGDLAQLAVTPAMRRRGVGTELLRAARRRTNADLTITNTDGGDGGTTGFLGAAGALERVRQHEMMIEL